MADSEFSFVADMIYRRSRIVIGPQKRPMLQGRLAKRLRALGLSDVGAYVRLLASPAGEDELAEMLNAVTTNVTAFFRETHHFRHLANVVLPRLFGPEGSGATRLRIWSAGCSTGQEPYSVAMTVHHALTGRARVDASILATDLDTNVLRHAEAARYTQEQASTVPEVLRPQFLLPDGPDHVAIHPAICDMVTFRPLNLIGPWPMRGPFDVVFCRNVVIYFDKPTQARLFGRIADLLAPGGWLYIGHSESLFNVSDRFELVGKTAYRKLS
jgi:chemotaxis protein methyltransferase CheR